MHIKEFYYFSIMNTDFLSITYLSNEEIVLLFHVSSLKIYIHGPVTKFFKVFTPFQEEINMKPNSDRS